MDRAETTIFRTLKGCWWRHVLVSRSRTLAVLDVFPWGPVHSQKSPDSLKTVNVMGIDASYDCSNDEVRRESECENASVRQI